MRPDLFLALFLAGGMAIGPVLGAPYEDPATGFKVDPPPPYFIKPVKISLYDEAVVVDSATNAPPMAPGDPYLCLIGLIKAPDTGSPTQAEINSRTQHGEFLANAAGAALSKAFDITSQSTFTLDGATGIELIGTSKTGTGKGFFVSLVLTPAGSTSLNCVTPADQLGAALAPFRAIRGAITLPTKVGP
jgi:hypothetical protein